MSRWSVWEWLVWLFGLTFCIGLIMLFSYGVWGPKTPPPPFDAKVEFTKSCKAGSYNNVPNVGSDNPADWKCDKIQ